ncbi:MAG: hypothetical protein JW776_05710 [Candidatus Lokiarchaeota archaeon]|nr:hypothetical protein [Candidatus Lokiarchaeota archaeon]
MPVDFPPIKYYEFLSETTPFLKIMESSLNLQIIFNLAVFNNLTLDELSEKMQNPNKDILLENLEKMISMELVEQFELDEKVHYKILNFRYQTQDYKNYVHFTPEEIQHHLHEEFLYSYRMTSLLKSIFSKLVHYICDFYINHIQNEKLNGAIVKEEMQHNTSVPRIGFVTKEEYDIYRNRFLEFENKMIEELMERRQSLGIQTDPNIEFMIANLFIPIKKVLEHT